MKSFSIRTPSPTWAETGIPAPTQASRPLDVNVIILPFLLFGVLLARFAAPLFKLLPVCTFRQVTGVPCPSCGATRAGLALAQGDLMAALSFNPLFVISLGILLGWSLCRMLERWTGKSFCESTFKKMAVKSGGNEFSAWRWQGIRWLAIGAIFLNWLYLILAA